MWGPFTGPKRAIFHLRKLPKIAQAGTKIFFFSRMLQWAAMEFHIYHIENILGSQKNIVTTMRYHAILVT